MKNTVLIGSYKIYLTTKVVNTACVYMCVEVLKCSLLRCWMMWSMVGLKREFMASGLILSIPCDDHLTKSTLGEDVRAYEELNKYK